MSNQPEAGNPFGPVIYTYTRKQAIADGFQVAIPTSTSAEAGIKFPVFFTREVFDQYVTVPAGVAAQDESGRLWDILWMLRLAATRGGELIRFQLYVRNDNRRAKLVTLKAQCGPLDFDDPQPAITVMLPEQD